MKKFSILLPVKNGGELIKACISSILEQTLADFDLVILENCSTDGTDEWLKTISDNRVVIYPAARPLSIEENWGRISDVPKNEFMTIIGHDDLLDKGYLSEMNDLIKKNPDASLYQSHFRFIDSNGAIIRSCKKMEATYSGGSYIEAILKENLDTMGSGYLMRTQDYDLVGGIPPFPNLLFADHTLWIQLASARHLSVSAKECFSYRINQSVSKLSGAVKYIDAFFMFLKFLEKLHSTKKNTQKIISEAAPRYIRSHCKSLSHRLLRTPVTERNGKNVSTFVFQCKSIADRLSPGNNFIPSNDFSVALAQMIDRNFMLRSLYLLFRKVYTNRIYS